MLKKNILFTMLIFSFFILVGCNQLSATNNPSIESNKITQNNKISVAEFPAEKIEVIHFYSTKQCWSCIEVGKLAFQTIKEKFPYEYENRIIIYRDVNGDLPENKDMVIKYQAHGSSLYINATINGQEYIEEDVVVWRLVSSKNDFISYFEKKLNKILGK